MSTCVIVSGTRALSDDERSSLDPVLRFNVAIRQPDEIYVGDASGVDALARGLFPDARVFTAAWKEFGKSAGPRRNKEMISAALHSQPRVVLIAFPRPTRKESPGTWGCIEMAMGMGVREVKIFTVNGKPWP